MKQECLLSPPPNWVAACPTGVLPPSQAHLAVPFIGTWCAGSVLTVLMQHLYKLPARPDCHSHLFILSSSFAGCLGDPKMNKLLQLVSLTPGYTIHFLELTGPEAELEAQAVDAGACCEDQRASRPGGAPAANLAFLQMLQGTQSCGNFTYDALVAGVLQVPRRLGQRCKLGSQFVGQSMRAP